MTLKTDLAAVVAMVDAHTARLNEVEANLEDIVATLERMTATLGRAVDADVDPRPLVEVLAPPLLDRTKSDEGRSGA